MEHFKALLEKFKNYHLKPFKNIYLHLLWPLQRGEEKKKHKISEYA